MEKKEIISYITDRIETLKEGKKEYNKREKNYTPAGHAYWGNINVIYKELESLLKKIKD
jgi:hypothetical protein